MLMDKYIEDYLKKIDDLKEERREALQQLKNSLVKYKNEPILVYTLHDKNPSVGFFVKIYEREGNVIMVLSSKSRVMVDGPYTIDIREIDKIMQLTVM